MRISTIFTSIDKINAMKRLLLLVIFTYVIGFTAYSQPNFLVSCPAEIKMVGVQSHYFVSKRCFLLYYPNNSSFKLAVNMRDLADQSNGPLPGDGIEYNTNIDDTNHLTFEGFIPEDKIWPRDNLKETYTFSITGTVKFRGMEYGTQIVCSYGARMIRNPAQPSINVNVEILKMELPMYIPAIKELIDNLKIKIDDGTVNMVQN